MEPKKIFIRTISIAGAIIVVLIGGVWYVRSDISTRLEAIRQARATIYVQEKAISELAVLQSDAEKAKQYTPKIDQLLTTKEKLLGFSTDIGFLAQQAGFSGTPQFKEETGPAVGDLQKTNFSLQLEGRNDLSDLARFFAAVERSNYFVRFSEVDVSRDGDALRASMSGYVVSF